MLRERFGQNVQYYRRQQKLTQEMAAELCGISSKYMGRIERGEQSVGIDIIEKISTGLKIPVEDLVAARDFGKDSITTRETGRT